ncbi:TetR/AcrR family transcriptional regulator [Nocardia sp. NPDC055321]
MTKPPLPRDAAATRRRILDAATAEFAAFGLAGARTARIAEAARSNPRMLYAYYGSKNALFAAVLNHHAAAHMTIPFDAEDLPRYALHLFDHYRAAPHLARLLLWQSLERPDLANASPTLRAATEHRIAAIEYAQSTGHVTLAVPAASLLDQIHTLARADVTESTLPFQRTADQRHELAFAVAALVDPRRVAATTP